MTVRMTAYIYPWDLARIGVAQALRQMAELGIEAVDLAATYHPIDALSPRDRTARLFTSARGAVHFPARPAMYGRIKPAVSAPEVCAAWPAAAAAACSLGLALNAWTVVLFQPWILDAYPDCARVLPSGDPIGSGVCAANDDVRDYVATLCADVVNQFGVETIRLEGITAASYDYGWLRPRVLVDVPTLARELLAACFCPTCVRRANAEGLDVDRLRGLVNGAVAAELAGGSAAAGADRAASLAADVELRSFLALHARASAELAAAVADRLAGPAAPRLSTTAWVPYSTLLGPALDDVLARIIGVVDQVVAPKAWVGRLRAIAARESRSLEFATLLVPANLAASVSHGAAVPAEQAELADRVASNLTSAAEAGVSEVSLYNFGLLRAGDVSDLAAAVRETFR